MFFSKSYCLTEVARCLSPLLGFESQPGHVRIFQAVFGGSFYWLFRFPSPPATGKSRLSRIFGKNATINEIKRNSKNVENCFDLPKKENIILFIAHFQTCVLIAFVLAIISINDWCYEYWYRH